GSGSPAAGRCARVGPAPGQPGPVRHHRLVPGLDPGGLRLPLGLRDLGRRAGRRVPVRPGPQPGRFQALISPQPRGAATVMVPDRWPEFLASLMDLLPADTATVLIDGPGEHQVLADRLGAALRGAAG